MKSKVNKLHYSRGQVRDFNVLTAFYFKNLTSHMLKKKRILKQRDAEKWD